MDTEWYHHYKLSHQKVISRHLEGIEFVLLELPNFIPENMQGRKIMALWLKFLKEINNHTTMIPQDILEVPEIAEAVEALKETSYSRKELEQYEKYWDIVRTQKAFVQDALKKGKREEKISIAKNLKSQGLDIELISKVTGLDITTINDL
jgi:predicted transposase/invertase (TIGR01784 family)